MAAGQEVVVITVASAGVARALVREFAQRRCRLGLIARNGAALDAAGAEAQALGYTGGADDQDS